MLGFASGATEDGQSADRSQLVNLPGFARFAEYNSAIRQITNLRYNPEPARLEGIPLPETEMRPRIPGFGI